MVFRYPHLWPSVFTLLECIFKANTSMFNAQKWQLFNEPTPMNIKQNSGHVFTHLDLEPPQDLVGNDAEWLTLFRRTTIFGPSPLCTSSLSMMYFFNRNLSFLVVPRWFKDNMLMVLITFTSAKQKTNDTLEEFWQRYIHIVVLDANVTVTVTVNAINHWAFGHAWEKGFWDLLGLSLLTKNQCRINRNV